MNLNKVVINDNKTADKLIELFSEKKHATILVLAGAPRHGKKHIMELIHKAVNSGDIPIHVNVNSYNVQELDDCVVRVSDVDTNWKEKYEQEWHEEFFNTNFACRKCKLDFHDCTCFDNPLDKRRFLSELHNYWYR